MSGNHKRWLERANGPLPDPLPKFKQGKCPAYREPLSCSDYPNAIWLLPTDWGNRRAFYHELTHWFDYQYLSDEDRDEIRARYDWPDLPWAWPSTWNPETETREPNCERLAWAGVEMYLHPHKYKWLRHKMRQAKHRNTRGGV